MPKRLHLGIGQHGKRVPKYLGDGVWLAQCRVSDTDGAIRRVQRIGLAEEFDKHGKFAVDALIDDSARGYGVDLPGVARHLYRGNDGR